MAAAGYRPAAGVDRHLLLSALLLLALGVYFRCAGLSGQPFEPDEGLKSLRALVVEVAPQPPLYHLLLRLWAGLLGDSLLDLRAFSVLAGFLAILLGYWLVLELFGSRSAAGLAAALVTVSPFHVLHSRQARPSAFVTLIIVASCLALLRALRLDRRRDWFLYDLSVVAGVYTHLFFIAVVAAQGVYVAAWTRDPAAWPRRCPPALARYLKAAVGGVLAFLPWVVVMVCQHTVVRGELTR
jgi:uncharacterized membrane protein